MNGPSAMIANVIVNAIQPRGSVPRYHRPASTMVISATHDNEATFSLKPPGSDANQS